MDEVTRDMVKAQLRSAKTSEALNGAMVSAMIAVVDCQCKTGMRVKRQGLILAGIGVPAVSGRIILTLVWSKFSASARRLGSAARTGGGRAPTEIVFRSIPTSEMVLSASRMISRSALRESVREMAWLV